MNDSNNVSRVQQIIVLILTMALTILIVFYGSLPESYNFQVGSVSDSDIYASRTFVDTYDTELKATLARNSVPAVFIRSVDLSKENVDKVKNLFKCISESRAKICNTTETVTDENGQEKVVTKIVTANDVLPGLKTSITNEIGVCPKEEDLLVYLNMTNSAYSYMSDRGIAIAELIMIKDINENSLETAIKDQMDTFIEANASYAAYAEALNNMYSVLLTENSVFDETATEEAASNAYNEVINNPVTIEKGTKIVAVGDVINEHTYQSLVDLELIRNNTFDWVILSRVTIYLVIIFIALVIYLYMSNTNITYDLKVFYMMILTFIIPLPIGIYLSSISYLLSVEIFLAAIAATYVGTSAGIIISLANLLMMWPIYNFDIEMFVINFVAIIVCCSIAGKNSKNHNSALLIILPSISALITSIGYNYLNTSTREKFITSVIMTILSMTFSLVAAVGLMPIYELITNAVTPVRLIYLSQPGHPLLKRLFFEASGTYQHSIMVSNLADAAAEAIGADALFCKVSAYYHDIGKLENPSYFTENQSDGYNPHNDIPVMDSVSIITKHPEDGLKLARKYRLPNPILKVIDEHHGTTYPAYFYNKACEEATAQGLEKPSLENFKYRGHIPSSKESAIVMIADTCEAAIRSHKDYDLDQVEKLIRILIKKKIEQDQLSNSGLSFDDIENIIQAFKQVYAGAFHERIKYPENAN